MLNGGPVNKKEGTRTIHFNHKKAQKGQKFSLELFVPFVAYLNQLTKVKRSPLATGKTS